METSLWLTGVQWAAIWAIAGVVTICYWIIKLLCWSKIQPLQTMKKRLRLLKNKIRSVKVNLAWLIYKKCHKVITDYNSVQESDSKKYSLIIAKPSDNCDTSFDHSFHVALNKYSSELARQYALRANKVSDNKQT